MMDVFELIEKDPEVGRVYAAIRTSVPSFRVVEKEGSLLMRIIGALLFFNRRFNSDFITTIGTTVYWPRKRTNAQTAIEVLLHEATHACDKQRLGMAVQVLLYLSPQLFALGALSSIVVGWWGLLFLLFLLPIPSPGRMWIEARGYGMSLAVLRAFGKRPTAAAEAWIANSFTGPNYYYMWPWKRSVLARVRAYADAPEHFAGLLATFREVEKPS